MSDSLDQQMAELSVEENLEQKYQKALADVKVLDEWLKQVELQKTALEQAINSRDETIASQRGIIQQQQHHLLGLQNNLQAAHRRESMGGPRGIAPRQRDNNSGRSHRQHRQPINGRHGRDGEQARELQEVREENEHLEEKVEGMTKVARKLLAEVDQTYVTANTKEEMRAFLED